MPDTECDALLQALNGFLVRVGGSASSVEPRTMQAIPACACQNFPAIRGVKGWNGGFAESAADGWSGWGIGLRPATRPPASTAHTAGKKPECALGAPRIGAHGPAAAIACGPCFSTARANAWASGRQSWARHQRT